MTEPTPAHFICPSPFKIGDILTSERTIYPAWWQIWKKPYRVTETLEVKSVYPEKTDEEPSPEDKQDALIDLAYANGYSAGWTDALKPDGIHPNEAMHNRREMAHKVLFGYKP